MNSAAITAIPVGSALGDHLHALLRDVVGPVPYRLVVVSMSKDDNPKATVLVLVDGDRTPSFAVKVARGDRASAAVLREAAVLKGLGDLETEVGHTIPRLVGTRWLGSSAAMVTTACRGQPMGVAYHRWRHTASLAGVSADFARAAAWLERLSEIVVPDRLTFDPAPPRPGDYWVDQVRRRWPGDDAVGVVAEWATALRGPMASSRAGLVHGDFWCGNVLCEAGAISGVVDWEHAAESSDPLRDRVRFALSYALYLDRHTTPGARVAGHPGLVAGTWGEPVRYALLGGTWFGSTVCHFVGDGLAASGRSRDLWRHALVLGLVECAATSDHADFARHHLDLAAELSACT